MKNKEVFTEINEDYVQEILDISKDMFDSKLYFKCSEHPCGWDSVDLDDIESIYNSIDIFDISNAIYDTHPFSYKTLYEIIKIVGMNGWSFVPPTICPDDFNTITI